MQGPERLPTGDIEAIFSLRDSDFSFSMVRIYLRNIKLACNAL